MSNLENYNFYELTTLLEDEDSTVVEELIETAGAKKVEIVKVVKVDLAYRVKDHDTAFMIVATFDLPSESAEKLNQSLNMNNAVLRHILLRGERDSKDSKEKPKVRQKRSSDKSSSKKRPTSDKKSSKPKTLTNEALEEKIEELQ